MCVCVTVVKVGLCANLRNLVWCGETHSDLFFPRCFLLSSPEEKDSFISETLFTSSCILSIHTLTAYDLISHTFTLTPDCKNPIHHSHTHVPIPSKHVPHSHTKYPHSSNPIIPTDDYRFATALNILKLVTDQQWGRFQSQHNTFSPPTPSPATPHTAQNTPQQTGSVSAGSSVKIGLHGPPCEPPVVPEEAVGLALRACSAYVSSRLHEDIEEESKVRRRGRGERY